MKVNRVMNKHQKTEAQGHQFEKSGPKKSGLTNEIVNLYLDKYS